MSENKCYVIMQTAWAWNDSNYYLENGLNGYAQEVFASKEKAEKVKEKLEYERWRDKINLMDDEYSLYLFEKLGNIDAYANTLQEKGYDIANLSEEAYHYLKNLLHNQFKSKFEELLQNTTENDWRIYIEDDYYELFRSYKIGFWSDTRVRESLESEGYPLDKNISDEGVKRFQALLYEDYIRIPEFYYIQEAIIVED